VASEDIEHRETLKCWEHGMQKSQQRVLCECEPTWAKHWKRARSHKTKNWC